jgi:carboxylate-amine ligase
MLWRLRVRNQRWRIYDRFLIGENRWRAQRYGVSQGLIDFGAAEIAPFNQLADELCDLLQEDAEALGCVPELERIKEIAANGNSADSQRAVCATAHENGSDHGEQMRAVVHHLIEEFHQDL